MRDLSNPSNPPLGASKWRGEISIEATKQSGTYRVHLDKLCESQRRIKRLLFYLYKSEYTDIHSYFQLTS